MNRELKAKWLTALRDGSHKQGRFRLRRASEETFCCLGVLCDVASPESWSYDERREVWLFGRFDDSFFAPSELLHRDIQENLSRMNDTGGLNFEDIANYIEQYIVAD